MEHPEDHSYDKLQKYPYRYLQKVAKSMKFPSNVKKTCLIEMILAKRYCSQEQVNVIVERIREERRMTTKPRMSSEVSPTNNQSPISMSSDNSSDYVVTHPSSQCQAVSRYQHSSNNLTIANNADKSDRVLRSSKNPIRPNYNILNADRSIIRVITAQSSRQVDNIDNGVRQLVPENVTPSAKNQRRLTGVYTFMRKDTYQQYVQSIGSRRQGESQTTNAAEQKDVSEIVNRNAAVNVERDYPNMSAFTDTHHTESRDAIPSCSSNHNSPRYYDKKLREEHVTPQRQRSETLKDRTKHTTGLPMIARVFSRPNKVQHDSMTEPLYVHINDNIEKHNNTLLPETDCKKRMIPRDSNPTPLCPNIGKRKKQGSGYSGSTAVTIPDALPETAACHSAPYRFAQCLQQQEPVAQEPVAQEPVAQEPVVQEPVAQEPVVQEPVAQEPVSPLLDFLNMVELNNLSGDEALNYFLLSLESTTPQLGADVSISDMLNDAMEIVIQDGNYMERTENDGSIECVICEWAGPRFSLEYHIRNVHASSISHEAGPEWRVSSSLGAPVLRILRHGASLLAVNATCAGDYFTADVMAIPTTTDNNPKRTRLTVYNKVTGEPHTWEGDVTPLPDTKPYQSNGNGLKLEISKLDLLPNSANLQLRNGELVLNSTAKVVVGQPELNNIEIVVHVEIFD